MVEVYLQKKQHRFNTSDITITRTQENKARYQHSAPLTDPRQASKVAVESSKLPQEKLWNLLDTNLARLLWQVQAMKYGTTCTLNATTDSCFDLIGPR